MPALPDIGIIGGSGFYRFLTDPQRVRVDTPFGPPSAELAVGDVGGRSVAFLPRHGERHQFPPHRVNYRANLWALRSVGVRQVLGPCAVGSLKPEYDLGTFVVPDQLVDRTYRSPHSIYDDEGPVVHVPFADPYCPRGRAAVLASSGAMVDGGTLVVVDGPRFSTRAESKWHAAQGWSLVGMTCLPEASVARELALCYTTVALVTDHDAGVKDGNAVTQAQVLRIFTANVERMKSLITDVITRLPAPETDNASPCPCRRALDGFTLPFDLP